MKCTLNFVCRFFSDGINLVVSGSKKIHVVLYFLFDSLNLRKEWEIIKDLLEKIPIENDWYLVSPYFVTQVELSNCKHKKFHCFFNFKKWISMKKNAFNVLKNFVTMTIVELDT